MFRALDKDRDWQFGKGKQSYVTGQQEIILNLETRILCFFKDCFFDMNSGIDWFNLLGNYNTREEIVTAVRATIVGTDGILKVNSVEYSIDENRNLQIKFDVATIYSREYEGFINVGEILNYA